MTQHNINWKQLAAAFNSVLTLSAALPYSLGELVRRGYARNHLLPMGALPVSPVASMKVSRN
jgi:hypothetical protein